MSDSVPAIVSGTARLCLTRTRAASSSSAEPWGLVLVGLGLRLAVSGRKDW